MAIIWDPKLDTGIEVIDAQHHRLVGYVNDLEVAKMRGDKALVGEVIEQLVDYTLSHFSFEEAMMEEAGYKFLKPHQKVHELFIKRVTTFTMRAAKGEDIVDELHSMLTTWLINHIASEDRDYALAVQKMVVSKESALEHFQHHEVKHGFISNLIGRFFH